MPLYGRRAFMGHSINDHPSNVVVDWDVLPHSIDARTTVAAVNFIRQHFPNLVIQQVQCRRPSLVVSQYYSMDALQDLICSICLKRFAGDARVPVLTCRHTFHRDCLLAWYGSCPLCRAELGQPLSAESDRDHGNQME